MTGAETHAEERGPIRLAVVVPCFNEEEVLKPAVGTLLGVIADMEKWGDIDSASTLLIVDDGSTGRVVADHRDARPRKPGGPRNKACPKFRASECNSGGHVGLRRGCRGDY